MSDDDPLIDANNEPLQCQRVSANNYSRRRRGAVVPPFGSKREKFGQIAFCWNTRCETKQIKPNDLLTRNL